ncbi:MAG: ABC transporter substrate-binding protein [Candidatus Poribacteria bacterium]|nr:ABC transporter substrate-binding protein [Candidatus Poribacteria bacterium]
MLFQQNTTTLRYIAIFGVLASFLVSCNRIQGVVTPDGTAISDGASTVKIGFIYSPPDPGTTRNGAELAVALANEAGGINGLPIELLIRDDKRDASLSVQHAEGLIAAGVSAIVGPDYSTVAVEVGAVVQRYGIPMVTTYPTHPDVLQNGNFSFMGAYIDPYQARIMADFAIQELGAITAAVLTETGIPYSEGLSTAFIEDFTARGGTIAVHPFYETGTTDFTEQLLAIAAVEPTVDIVFLPGLGSEFPLAVKQARSDDIGISATFLGGDGWDRPDLVEIGGIALEGSFFANHFSPDGQLIEDVRQFVNAYTEKYGIAPDGPAALGYDAATIVIEAMHRTTDLTPAAIRDQIEATQDYRGATTLSHFDENRHAIKSLVINTVRDGNIQFHQFVEP